MWPSSRPTHRTQSHSETESRFKDQHLKDNHLFKDSLSLPFTPSMSSTSSSARTSPAAKTDSTYSPNGDGESRTLTLRTLAGSPHPVLEQGSFTLDGDPSTRPMTQCYATCNTQYATLGQRAYMVTRSNLALHGMAV